MFLFYNSKPILSSGYKQSHSEFVLPFVLSKICNVCFLHTYLQIVHLGTFSPSKIICTNNITQNYFFCLQEKAAEQLLIIASIHIMIKYIRIDFTCLDSVATILCPPWALIPWELVCLMIAHIPKYNLHWSSGHWDWQLKLWHWQKSALHTSTSCYLPLASPDYVFSLYNQPNYYYRIEEHLDASVLLWYHLLSTSQLLLKGHVKSASVVNFFEINRLKSYNVLVY